MADTQAASASKTPYINRHVQASATGARFLPGRVPHAESPTPEKILFHGVPFYDKVMQGDDAVIAGVPFGPGMETDPTPGSDDLDKFKLEDGARIILAGATEDSRVVKPQYIKIGDKKRRKQIFQFSLNKSGSTVIVMPEEDGKFVWEIWTGFYSRQRLDEARILMQNGQFLHGAGPFQGASYVATDITASTTGLAKIVKKGGLAQEVKYRLGMVDGVPLWQAYYYVAEYSPRQSQAVLVRQLHQCYLLVCPGGKPQFHPFPAEQFAHSYNELGLPITPKA